MYRYNNCRVNPIYSSDITAIFFTTELFLHLLRLLAERHGRAVHLLRIAASKRRHESVQLRLEMLGNLPKGIPLWESCGKLI